MQTDYLIKDVRVIDGSGSDPYTAEVAIENGTATGEPAGKFLPRQGWNDR